MPTSKKKRVVVFLGTVITKEFGIHLCSPLGIKLPKRIQNRTIPNATVIIEWTPKKGSK